MNKDQPHCSHSWTYGFRLVFFAAMLLLAGRAGATCSAAWTYTIHGDTLIVQSVDTSSANHHYWSFNGTYNTADHTTLTQVFPNYGTQHICQYVYTTGGGCSDSSCVDVTIPQPTTCHINTAWTYTTHGDTVYVTAADTSTVNHHWWTFDGHATTTNSLTATYVFAQPGTYRVCLHAYTPGTNCVDSLCQYVTIQNSSTCTLTAGWQYYLHGDTAYFFAGATNTAAHYFWNFGDGSPIGTGPTLTHVYANSGLYHVCLYDYIPNTACADSFCQNVSVTTQQCHVSAAFTYTVHGDTIFLHSTDTLSANYHYWTINGTVNTVNHISWYQVFPNFGTQRICLHIYTPGTVCVDSSCTSVTLTAPCHYSAAWTYSALGGDSIRFHAADTSSAAHRYWSFGDGATASTIDPVHVYAAPGTYHVCLYAYIPGTGCVDSFCNTIIVAGCNVHANWQYYMRGDTGHFYAATNSNATNFYWSYGDGTTGSGATPQHVYAHAGTYHVCLYAYTSTNCRDSFCNTITVGAGCHVSAAWTYTVHGDTVFLHSSDTLSGNNHYWTFGTPNYVSGTSVTHVFTGPGTYHICLHVYTPGTTCSDSSCNTITIANTCSLHPAWQYYTVHDSVHFYNFSNDSTVHLDWRFGDGQYGFGTNPWHGYAALGTYQVCCFVYTNGCVDSFCNQITVGSGCHVSAAWTYTIHGDTVFLHSTDTLSANHHYWSINGVYNTANHTALTQVFPNFGTQHICLYVYTPGTTCSDSSCNNITLHNTNCVANAAWTSVISGTSVAFHATDTFSAVSMDWNLGDGTWAFDQNPTHTYTQPGTYHVCCYAYTSNTCVDSFCNTIVVGTGCHVSALWTYTIHGDTVYLTAADTTSANHHYWIFGSNTSTVVSGVTATHVYTGPGTYHICLYVYTPGTNCSDSSCNNVTITNPCNVHAAWQSYTVGDTAHFFAGTASGVNYYWSFGDGTTGSGANPLHTYANAGTYHVCLYAYSNTNCRDSFCNTITISGGCHITSAWTYAAYGDSVHFTGLDSNTLAHRYWAFGDGTSGSGHDVSHVYHAPGVYTVCSYIYIPGSACMDSMCNTVVVTGNCAVAAAMNYINVAHDTVAFYSLFQDSAANYVWIYGDGTTGSGSYSVHGYPVPGTYHICLRVFIPGTPCADSVCLDVNIGTNCAVTAAWASIPRGNDSLQFYAADPDTAAVHTWSFGDGGTATGSYAAHTYTAAGTYHVCLYVAVPGTTCADSLCRDITSALGIESAGSAAATISLRPNPMSQYAILSIDGPAATYEVRIYDMIGQQLRSVICVNNTIMIDRGALSAGIYTYAVLANGRMIGQGKLSVE
ncbi:MAG: PKD domain-containing protein [Bacteroidetes bacterium]|nr:PKD domain-containing protein [Bacteroidota bacterium]